MHFVRVREREKEREKERKRETGREREGEQIKAFERCMTDMRTCQLGS